MDEGSNNRLEIPSGSYLAYIEENGRCIRLIDDDNGKAVFQVTNHRVQPILSFYSHSCAILSRVVNDLVFLWVLYESSAEFVYFSVVEEHDEAALLPLFEVIFSSSTVNVDIEIKDTVRGPATAVLFTQRFGDSCLIGSVDGLLLMHWAEQGSALSVHFDELNHASVPYPYSSCDVISPPIHSLSYLYDTKPDDFRSQLLCHAYGLRVEWRAGQLTFISPRQHIFNEMLRLGSAAFVGEPTVSFDPVRDDVNIRGIHIHAAPTLSLSDACREYHMCFRSTHEYLQKSREHLRLDEKAWFARVVVLEAALECGLGSLIAEYVSAETESLPGGGPMMYVLEDVARLQHWVLNKLVRVQNTFKTMLSYRVVPFLLAKHRCQQQYLYVDLGVMIRESISLLDGLHVVLVALYQRKATDLTRELAVVDRQDYARQLLSDQLSSLGQQVREVKTLLETARVVQLVCEHSHLSCMGTLPEPQCEPSLSLVRVLRDKFQPPRSEVQCFLTDLFNDGRTPWQQPLWRSVWPTVSDETNVEVGSQLSLLGGDSEGQCHRAVEELFFIPYNSAVNGRSTTSTAITNPHSIVLFQLLDLLLINNSVLDDYGIAIASVDTLALAEGLAASVCSAAGISLQETRLVLNLWKIDMKVDVSSAVDDLVRLDGLLANDPQLLENALLRLICHGIDCSDDQIVDSTMITCACRLFTHFYPHPATCSHLLTVRGAVLFAATSLHENGWLEAKRFCDLLNDSQRVEAGRKVALVMCKWSRLTNQLGPFLLTNMDENEAGAVEVYLVEKAREEINSAVPPENPAKSVVNALVLWLARNKRIPEALEWHAGAELGPLSSTRESLLLRLQPLVTFPSSSLRVQSLVSAPHKPLAWLQKPWYTSLK